MANDSAQQTLAVSHLEICVPRLNLKTIIHHCFTHSRYFPRLKAQVNHLSFQHQPMQTDRVSSHTHWTHLPFQTFSSGNHGSNFAPRAVSTARYSFPDLNTFEQMTGKPMKVHNQLQLGKNAQQLKLTLSIYMMPNNNTNTNVTRTSETSHLHK